MIDDIYQNAFKEVSDILENTDIELVDKVSPNFINFIHEHMNDEYETNIKLNVDIDKQPLLKETEAILSLIYRTYWSTAEEKTYFVEKDKHELTDYKENEVKNYKDISEIFKNRRDICKISANESLMIIPKENFIIRLFKKIKNIIKK